MIFWEIICLSFSSLKANKLRSALTMIGIAVGIFTVIGVMTAVSGVQSKIEDGLNVLGANSFQVSKYPPINFSDPRERFANRRNVDYRQALRFKELMQYDARVSLIIQRGGRRVFHGQENTNPNVGLIGTDENYLTSFNYEVGAGRPISADDVNLVRSICLIGEDIRTRLFRDKNPIGEQIRIDGASLTIVGVLEAKGSSFGQSQDNIVITPISKWFNLYGRANRSIGINVQAPSAETLEEVQETGIGMMRIARGLLPEDPNDFETFTNDSLIETFNKVLGTVAIGAFVISAIALLAAGVGVMNIMLVSVTERTREIGVRKSLGARKLNILTQFLLEAVALSLFGGVIGVLLGVAGGNLAGQLLSADVVFPVGWATAGMVVCSGIGIIFGLYPAWKAASLDPIEALRYE
ncbi:ABC transporter permease [Synoicihabitans lomoniglobus]|uniref:ABC transporter permease n=1 Tax=Synoicihabitans lomoniglobus TaxID=2909285 RepID=A0AAE9ZX16_9BACT|nr:ABC transporter permease [Opitutaceae bacterium LMO-M01]WED65021.1 ABC transporter permease [Opitutaceae bacterium LMO-M01]